jgi:hypothetical protein
VLESRLDGSGEPLLRGHGDGLLGRIGGLHGNAASQPLLVHRSVEDN